MPLKVFLPSLPRALSPRARVIIARPPPPPISPCTGPLVLLLGNRVAPCVIFGTSVARLRKFSIRFSLLFLAIRVHLLHARLRFFATHLRFRLHRALRVFRPAVRWSYVVANRFEHRRRATDHARITLYSACSPQQIRVAPGFRYRFRNAFTDFDSFKSTSRFINVK